MKNNTSKIGSEITDIDIKEYLDNYSDFNFEMKVLKEIKRKNFDCAHSGTYEDPISKKGVNLIFKLQNSFLLIIAVFI